MTTNLSQDTKKSPYNRKVGSQTFAIKNSKKISSLTCSKLTVGKGQRQRKIGPDILSSTNWFLEEQPPEIYSKSMHFYMGLLQEEKNQSACFQESYLLS